MFSNYWYRLADFGTIKLGKKALILVSVPLAFEIFFAAVLLNMVQNSERETQRAEHSRMVYVYADTLVRRLYQIGVAMYAQSTMGGDLFSSQHERTEQKIKDDLSKLKATVSVDEKQSKSVKDIEEIIEQILRLFDASAKDSLGVNSEFPLHADEFNLRAELEPLIHELIGKIETLTEREKAIKKAKPDAEKLAKQQVRMALIAGVVLNVILAVWLAKYFNSSTTKRLGVVLENTQRLARGEQLGSGLKGEDEIAILDANFHQMAAELKKAEEAKKEAERLKQEFFQMISHDLRTPLTTSQFFVSVLLKGTYGEISSRGEKAARGSLQALDRVISMVNSLLDIEKLSSQSFALEKNNCHLEELLIKASESVNGFAEKQKVELDISVEEDLEFIADRDRIIQVLVNLAANAVKFSNEGQTVKVQGKKSGEFVEFSVIDQGRGIPEEHRKRIFERFS